MTASTAAAMLGPLPPLAEDSRTRLTGFRGPRPLVYLAEDNRDLRRSLTESLRDAGFDVLSAATGHEMLKLLTAAARSEVAPPDAIVMDIRMPRCNGIEVLGALRLADWKQPVVLITAFGDPSTHERAASYGASVVLDKPFASEDLVGVLDVLLRLAREEGGFDDDEEPEPETLRSPNSGIEIHASPIDVRVHVGHS